MRLPDSDHASRPWRILGHAYLAAIRPFRHLVVYPPMLRRMEREWAT